ncbi:hypothetical protein R1sor_010780 [Riccia sorocarpa]|uniref:Uncharacterized protein n=1 Tax=Riccia sorocarpa TaxID=122646 RepID=A0ABD3I2F5_9MARC
MERCSCLYICSRANPEVGYRYVAASTKRRHAEMDRKGKLASNAGIKGSRTYMEMASVALSSTYRLHNTNIGHRNGKSSHFDQQSCLRSTGPEVSRSTSYRDARAVAGAALLDTNNVSIDLQETILKILFSSDVPDMVENRQPDYRGMNLGSLLRYAGRDWREGELGLRGLCTLNGISRLYRNQGMPTVSRWKLCLGEGDSAHEPRAYAASRQDNYTSTGLKCNCNNRPSSGLQRDCDLCTERCEFTPCLLPRKQMESFDYIPIGAMVRMICRSRSFCHSMLAMWRAKHKWFRHDETELAPSFPIKDWWDGSKTKEISWFWDSDISWELPVVCMACLEVYQAFPVKCQELLANFDLPSRRYNFICKSCGTRVSSEATYAQLLPIYEDLLEGMTGLKGASRCTLVRRALFDIPDEPDPNKNWFEQEYVERKGPVRKWLYTFSLLITHKCTKLYKEKFSEDPTPKFRFTFRHWFHRMAAIELVQDAGPDDGSLHPLCFACGAATNPDLCDYCDKAVVKRFGLHLHFSKYW